MENYTPGKTKHAYGWTAIAAIATALLAAVPFLTLQLPPIESSQALVDALGLLGTVFVRTVLFVTLLCVTPALWARSAWRWHPAVLAGLSVIAFAVGTLLGGPLQGLYITGMIVPIGIALYVAQRFRVSNFKLVFYGSILILLGLFLLICVPTMISDGDAFLPMRNVVDAYRVIWETSSADVLAVDSSQMAKTLTENVSAMLLDYKMNANEYLISFLYVPSAIAALLNTLLSHAFNRKGGAELKPLPPFADWMVEPTYFYGALAFLVITGFVSMFGSETAIGLSQTAFILWVMPMGLLGLCTVHSWTKSKGWILVLVIVGTIVMLPMSLWALTVIGIFGFMRNRMQKRSQEGKR